MSNYYNPNPYYNNPNYYYNNPNYYMSPQQRLQMLEQQYPQYGQAVQQPIQQPLQQPPQQPLQSIQQPAQSVQTQSPIMSVSNEQQAREYPLDLSGSPQIFVMSDDSKIFAKRFNVGSALPEFETYEKVVKQEINTTSNSSDQNNPLILGIIQNFNDKLDNLHSEIQNLKEALINEPKSTGNSQFISNSKSTNTTDITASSGNGTSGAESRHDNESPGATKA